MADGSNWRSSSTGRLASTWLQCQSRDLSPLWTNVSCVCTCSLFRECIKSEHSKNCHVDGVPGELSWVQLCGSRAPSSHMAFSGEPPLCGTCLGRRKAWVNPNLLTSLKRNRLAFRLPGAFPHGVYASLLLKKIQINIQNPGSTFFFKPSLKIVRLHPDLWICSQQ